MLELTNLEFTYPNHPSRPQFSFSFSARPGQIIFITGPSGVGKSTLFDLIAGFLSPDAGDMTWNQRSLLPLAVEQRPVSLLFQANNLFDHLSVRENMSLVLSRTERKTAGARIDDLLGHVGLSGFSERRADSLSGGQQQRVALARTLLADRPIVLLDEPFSALDSETALETGKLVHNLTLERGWTTLLISHDTTMRAALPGNEVAIENGRIEQPL